MPTVTEGLNSYVSETEADMHFSVRLYSDAWDNTTPENRQKALLMARLLLDGHVRWKGRKASNSQALEWPRFDVDDVAWDSIPQAVKVAQSELALVLLQNDVTAIPETAGLSEIRIDSISLKIDPKDRLQVIPDNIYALISHFGRRAGSYGVASLTR